MNEQNLFRVGGIYRQNNGAIVRLEEVHPSDLNVKTAKHYGLDVSQVAAVFGDDIGWRLLSNGRTTMDHGPDYIANLIPGEVNEQGEPIKPEACCCGEPEASGVVHRTDAPCYHEESPEVDTTWRPALTWADSKPFEAFPGFSVQSETHPDEPTPIHALQRLAEGDPRCGSAWLLGR